jgi:hypothetical protein
MPPVLTTPYPSGLSRATIEANRKCREYVMQKKTYGTLTTIADSSRPAGTLEAPTNLISVWLPDNRSISELWTEARLITHQQV